jgi:hypothetical protein
MYGCGIVEPGDPWVFRVDFMRGVWRGLADTRCLAEVREARIAGLGGCQVAIVAIMLGGREDHGPLSYHSSAIVEYRDSFRSSLPMVLVTCYCNLIIPSQRSQNI